MSRNLKVLSPALTSDCIIENDRITFIKEKSQDGIREKLLTYDNSGRLKKVDHDSGRVEEYFYDEFGRRKFINISNQELYCFSYNENGFPFKLNDCSFLAGEYYCFHSNKQTKQSDLLIYELVNGKNFRRPKYWTDFNNTYEYQYVENQFYPAIKYCNNEIAEVFALSSKEADASLLAYFNIYDNSLYHFNYRRIGNNKVYLYSVIVIGQVLQTIGYDKSVEVAEFVAGYDYLGSLKRLEDLTNGISKVIEYDSFGSIVTETLPHMFIPMGFAGGLRDRHNGLVRFGYRSYDPIWGRFTTTDPAKDARGDGDLRDYCVDDPVNKIDRIGLEFTSVTGAQAAVEGHKGISHRFGGKHDENSEQLSVSNIVNTDFYQKQDKNWFEFNLVSEAHAANAGELWVRSFKEPSIITVVKDVLSPITEIDIPEQKTDKITLEGLSISFVTGIATGEVILAGLMVASRVAITMTNPVLATAFFLGGAVNMLWYVIMNRKK